MTDMRSEEEKAKAKAEMEVRNAEEAAKRQSGVAKMLEDARKSAAAAEKAPAASATSQPTPESTLKAQLKELHPEWDEGQLNIEVEKRHPKENKGAAAMLANARRGA